MITAAKISASDIQRKIEKEPLLKDILQSDFTRVFYQMLIDSISGRDYTYGTHSHADHIMKDGPAQAISLVPGTASVLLRTAPSWFFY